MNGMFEKQMRHNGNNNQDVMHNQVTLTGTISKQPEFAYEIYGECFLTMMVTVKRLSDAEDILPVTISERLWMNCLMEGTRVTIRGQIRTYNKFGADGKNHLSVILFAEQVLFASAEDDNQVLLKGVICRKPEYRDTPLGRQVCDLKIACNRKFGKTDYIPCITWGRTAWYTATLPVGAVVELLGRFQSRQYEKVTNDGIESRTAYEISVSQLHSV